MTESDFNAWEYRGFYAAFPRPFYVTEEPAHHPADEPLVSLCFNEDYLPYVQGALKALASELTWRGPTSCVQSWVQAMMDLLLTEPVSGCGEVVVSVPTGLVMPFAGSVLPDGFLACDGAAVSRTTYADLFDVIGTTYGSGDGSTTFNVPNLKGRTAIGTGTGTGLTPRTLAANGGEETHVLSTAEMPSHVHSMYPVGGGGTRTYFAVGASDGSNTPNTGVNTFPTGGGGSHNNMQPFLALNYVIKA